MEYHAALCFPHNSERRIAYNGLRSQINWHLNPDELACQRSRWRLSSECSATHDGPGSQRQVTWEQLYIPVPQCCRIVALWAVLWICNFRKTLPKHLHLYWHRASSTVVTACILFVLLPIVQKLASHEIQPGQQMVVNPSFQSLILSRPLFNIHMQECSVIRLWIVWALSMITRHWQPWQCVRCVCVQSFGDINQYWLSYFYLDDLDHPLDRQGLMDGSITPKSNIICNPPCFIGSSFPVLIFLDSWNERLSYPD